MTTQVKAAPTKVVTGEVRFSHFHAFVAKAKDLKKPDEKKFSICILIPKSDKATLAKLEGARETAIEAKWGSKRPPKIATTLHDGDGVREKNGEPFSAECKGHWVMDVSTKNRPGVVDADRNEILDATAVISGDYGRVSINAYAYDYDGSRGISFGLNNVQFLRKGEPLTAGGGRAADDFADNDDDF